MNNIQKTWFFTEIKINRGSDTEISKQDIIDYAQGNGLEFKKNIAKASLVDLIVANGFENDFYDTFQEYVFVPEWDLREILMISKKQFNELVDLGLIPHKPMLKEFKGRSGRFKAEAYPLSALELDGEELKELHRKAYSSNTFKIRVETKNVEELKEIVDHMSKLFELTEYPTPYEHRDGSGYYSYFKMRMIENDSIAHDAQLLKLSKLQNDVADLKEKLHHAEQEARKSKFELYRMTETRTASMMDLE